MKKTSLPARALSIALSSALAFTLMPSAAFATASEALAATAAESAQTEQAEDAETPASVEDTSETSEDGSAASTSGNTSASTEASAPVVVNEERAIAPTTTTASDEAPERIRVEVSVGATAVTVLSYNGMNFQIGTAADEPTATLVGLSTAPTGALDIPAQIVSNGITYPVTNIGSIINLGGGGRASE